MSDLNHTNMSNNSPSGMHDCRDQRGMREADMLWARGPPRSHASTYVNDTDRGVTLGGFSPPELLHSGGSAQQCTSPTEATHLLFLTSFDTTVPSDPTCRPPVWLAAELHTKET